MTPRPISVLVLALWACLLVALVSPAALARKDRGAESTAFTGPEVFKVDWNSRAMTPCDLNGDGRLDIALLNNDRAKIDLLIQRDPDGEAARTEASGSGRLWQPVLEDARFAKQSIVTSISTFALAAGDLDGDGRVDLAYTGSPDALTLRFQGEGGDWQRRRVIELDDPSHWTTSLAIADLDGDGREDLILLAESELLVFHGSETGEAGDPLRMALAERDCHGLMATDLDADGRLDLGYLSQGARAALCYRLQDPDGGFGPEQRLDLEAPRGELRPLGGTGSLPGGSFVSIQDRTGLLNEIRILAAAADGDPFDLKPRIRFVGGGGRSPACYALGDFNGDGRLDLAAGDGEQARVQLFFQDERGNLSAPEFFPTLSDLRGLAAGDVDGDGRDEVLALSSREKSIGWSRYEEQGRLAFPEPLPVKGQPLAFAAADLDGDGDLELAYARELENERQVAIMDRDPSGGGNWQESVVTLTGLRTNPSALEVQDLNQDGRLDLAIYTVQSPLRLLLQGENGAFEEASLESGFRQGLVDRLDAAATSACDFDGDGHDEFLVAGKGFARALRMDAQGRLEVSDQFNAQGGEVELSAALGVDLDADGSKEVLLIEKGTGDIQILRSDSRGVYRHERTYEGGRIDLVDARVLDLDADTRPDLLLLGKDRFWRVPVGAPGLTLEQVGSYETDLPDHEYTELIAADLDGDGADEVITMDAVSSHILEILERDETKSGAWRSIYHFTVFEENPHYRGWRGGPIEPREILAEDMTGDGVPDLLLLVHDRILLYPGL